jgi:uncharacterized lipoprotein YmbA
MRHLTFMTTALAVSLLILSGCSSTPPQMRYYQLSSTSAAVTMDSEALSELALGVGPIAVPEMLKRQEIVTRSDDGQYQMTDMHRWAGLFESDLTTVVIENLGKLLGTEQINSYPWDSYFDPDYRIIIELLSLSGQPGGTASLRAGWTIVDRSGKQVMAKTIHEFEQKTVNESFNALVQAESQLVDQLCQEISKSVRGLTLN